MTIKVTLTTDRTTYAPAAPISARITATSDSSAALQFSTSQRCDFVIQDTSGSVVWSWGAERMFTEMIGQVEIGPGHDLVCDERFMAPSQPGTYHLVGTVVAGSRQSSAPLTITIRTP